MAKVYRTPEGFDTPDFFDFMAPGGSYDREAHDAARVDHEERLAEWCRNRADGKGNLVGKIVSFQIADGYARYMVASHKPLSLLWLNEGDNYAIPDAHARGLNLTDIRDLVGYADRLAAIFGRKKEDA